MLRRIKKEVEHEMAEKIEYEIHCSLSARQLQMYKALKEKISVEEILESSTNEAHMGHLMNLVMQFRKVCNHPEIFERRRVQSPFQFIDLRPELPFLQRNPIVYRIPKLIAREALLCLSQTIGGSISSAFREKLLYNDLNIFNAYRVHSFLFLEQPPPPPQSSFAFSRFLDLTPGDLECLHMLGLVDRWLYHLAHSTSYQKRLEFYQMQGGGGAGGSSSIPLRYSLHLSKTMVRKDLFDDVEDMLRSMWDLIKNVRCFYPTSWATTIECECIDPSFTWLWKDLRLPHRLAQLGIGELDPRENLFSFIKLPHSIVSEVNSILLEKQEDLCTKWQLNSCIRIPPFSRLLSDSGKLQKLDELLKKLKREGHRVLIYSQMTKMIDILEDFMKYRRYKYKRLDGSSKLSDRRDLVDAFQTRNDIFGFLLSTRAGGLGINLTAADTVIFYDSDWNPTMDAQAMDRAHRLGQTRQVTVYRLITKGTIEERILIRAKQKNVIQSIVISGGKFKEFRPQEVVSMLLDDEEVHEKVLKQQMERKKRRGRPPKTKQFPMPMPETTDWKLALLDNGIEQDLFSSSQENQTKPQPTRNENKTIDKGTRKRKTTPQEESKRTKKPRAKKTKNSTK
jgi:DNA helicase INO80